jgi:type IV secretion system protein VirB6
MFKRILSLALLLPFLALAQVPGPAPNAGVDWIYTVTNAVDDMVTSSGGILTPMGLYELSFFGFMGLMMIVIRWQAQAMNMHFHMHLNIGEVYLFLLKLLACSLIMNYYANPLPGSSISLHQIPSYLSLQIMRSIDNSLIQDVTDQVSLVISKTERPSALNVNAAGVYLSLLALMAVLSIAVFLINAFSFAGLGAMTVFGPIMIPFLMTRRLEQWFWGWLNLLVSFSMYRAVGAAFICVFAKLFFAFFHHTVNGDYSIGAWMALLPTLAMLTVTFLYSMLKVPSITSSMFGGAGAIGQSWSNDVQRVITASIR